MHTNAIVSGSRVEPFATCQLWGHYPQNPGIQNETAIGVTPDPFPHPKHRKKQSGHETIHWHDITELCCNTIGSSYQKLVSQLFIV